MVPQRGHRVQRNSDDRTAERPCRGSVIGQRPIALSAEQGFIACDQRELVHVSWGCQEPAGGIFVIDANGTDAKGHLARERRILHGHAGERGFHPVGRGLFASDSNASGLRQRQEFPDRDQRKPQLVALVTGAPPT